MIDYKLLKKIEKYAHEHCQSSQDLYRRRNQNIDLVMERCFNGKVAEYCAYFQLKRKGYQLDEPDLEIYEGHKKSFDSDLKVFAKYGELYDEPMHLHVKSISLQTAQIYGHTVVMERAEPIIKNPDKSHYWLIMKQIDLLNYSIYKFINSTEAHYDDCVTHKPTACAIYLD